MRPKTQAKNFYLYTFTMICWMILKLCKVVFKLKIFKDIIWPIFLFVVFRLGCRIDFVVFPKNIKSDSSTRTFKDHKSLDMTLFDSTTILIMFYKENHNFWSFPGTPAMTVPVEGVTFFDFFDFLNLISFSSCLSCSGFISSSQFNG